MFRTDASKMLMKDPATAAARIYIGNLSENVTSADLEAHFTSYGNILGVLLHRGFGFIQFETEQSANDAINMEHKNAFQGRSLVVRRAQSNAPVGGGPNAQENPMRPGRISDASPFPGRGGGEAGRGRGRDVGRGAHRGVGGGPGARMNMDRDRSPLERQDNDEWHNNSGCYSQDNQCLWKKDSFHKFTYNPSYAYNVDSSNIGPAATVKATPDRNDCEIIVVNKALTEYAEHIEKQLLRMGLTVDLLFPNEDVPIGRVLSNIRGRGCLYAILVMAKNEEHRSLTLNILHGVRQEHRNMPLVDAIAFIKRNYEAYCRGDLAAPTRAYPEDVALAKDRHPDTTQTLINLLADNRMLTVLQYDKVIRYLQERREAQVKIELGDTNDVPVDTVQTKTQQELQQRILNILNKPTESSVKSSIPEITAEPPPRTAQQIENKSVSTPLLQDPTVQKALDSLMQGNLLQNISFGGSRLS